jgi:hypothetical protein
MRAPTYGEVLDETEHHVLAAIDALHQITPNATNTATAIAGHVRLLHASAVHASFLADESGVLTDRTRRGTRAIQAFCDALSPWRRTKLDAASRDRTGPWHAAADRLGIAHDILATHIGPAHEPRSLEAAALREPGASATALQRLAAIVDVAVLAAPRLARQARQSTPDATTELALLEGHTMPLGIAAATLIDGLSDQRPDQRLTLMQPAPPLRLAGPGAADPLGIAAQALDVLGRHTIEQVRHPGVRSVATLHILTATSTSLIGHLEALAAALQHRNGQRQALLAPDPGSLLRARGAWVHAGRVLAAHPALAPAPRLLVEAALVGQRSLATLTRDGKRWRQVTEIANDPRLGDNVDASLARVVDRVALLGPHVAQLSYQCAEHGLLASRQQTLDGLTDRRLLPLGPGWRGHVPRLLAAAESATREAVTPAPPRPRSRPLRDFAPPAGASRRTPRSLR